MVKSNYGQIKKYENEILAMKEAGYTKRRIAEELALTKEQIKEFLKRHRRRERKIEVGIPVRPQGRSSKGNTVNDVELAQKYEIMRLKMSAIIRWICTGLIFCMLSTVVGEYLLCPDGGRISSSVRTLAMGQTVLPLIKRR